MDAQIRQSLQSERTVDITTTGRRSGQPRRIETWLYRSGGRLYLTGSPGARDWQANLAADPTMTIHLKGSLHADVAATATLVTDPVERRRVIEALDHPTDVDAWVAGSPLVELTPVDDELV